MRKPRATFVLVLPILSAGCTRAEFSPVDAGVSERTPGASVACKTGYLCTAGTCASTCTTDAGCDSSNGYGCFAGACLKKNGQSCSVSAECGSGSCVGSGGAGSVCCASACVDKACGSKALCLSNGSGCQTHNGEACATVTCSSDLRAAISSTCNGSGSCVAASSTCTLGYVCAAGLCATSCTSDSACDVAAGFSCNTVSKVCVRVTNPVDGGP